MVLKNILRNIENLKGKGNLDIDITGITRDSREVKEGNLFIAIKGYESDGKDYINTAIEKGAKAIVIEESVDLKSLNIPESVAIIVAQDTRKALAICSCNFYDNPSRKFKLIGITGTKGKTTTAFMIKSILEKQGKKIGLIGTIATYICNKKIEDSDRTTPESNKLQELFSKMVEAEVEYVIMEVSSQSLKLDRVYGSDFDIGVFTNFSKDHISPKEHSSMEEYFQSKLKLIEICKKSFINSDNLNTCKVLKLFENHDISTYGIDNPSNCVAKDITITNSSVDFKVKINARNERIKICIPGRFSVYNALAAICVTVSLGCSSENIKESLLEVRVPGRSELVDNNKNLTIMIDYAHSPESLENILSAVKSYTQGKLISVFGCGGDRDSTKRPLMGEISSRISDYTIITSDNPRTEEPEKIAKEIEKGIKKPNYELILDRTEAIKKAISMANKKDIVVLAGKGHENYQEINGKKYDFDERIVVKEILKQIK